MNDISLLPNYVLMIYIFIFGICVGSFLNVAILRGLSGEDMVFSRSHCPKCLNQLKWYMNIPLLSFIFLRGKCGFCKTKISFQYPLVEFICGVSFVVSFLAFGFTLKTLFVCLFMSIFILLSATDFKETVIIDYHAYILLALGLLYSYLKLGDITITQAIIGAFVGFLLFEIIARIGYLIANHRMFGEGDSLIALGLGAIFGSKIMILIFVLSVAIQAIFSIPILVKKALDKKQIKLGISYILVILGSLSVLYLNIFNPIQNENIHFGIAIFISIFLLYALKNIMIEIKNKKDVELSEDEQGKQYNLMPFGPALIFASVLCLFFLPQIKNIIIKFLG